MTHTSTRRLTYLAVFFAIILVQEFTPLLGNLPIGPFSLTLIDITIFVSAALLGPRDAATIGGFWGIVTFIRAFTFPSSPIAPLVFTNPLISILPKIIMGWLCGFLIFRFGKIVKRSSAIVLSVIVTEVVTGIMTLLPIYIFYASSNVEHAFGVTTGAALGKALLLIVATNAIPETLIAAIATPLIDHAISKQRNR